MTGHCLCGAVVFEFEGPASEVDICHCSRCRRVTGSAFSTEFRVPAESFRWLRGADRIAVYDAPVLREPPAYRASFCSICGSTLPSVFPGQTRVAIPAGLIDDDVQTRAAKHIWISQKLGWLDLHELAGLPVHPTE